MPILYDQYQLANSTQIPRFVGSAVPELMKVTDTLQNQYDYGVQFADSLDYALKNSTASKFDEPEFAKLKQEYKNRLEQYAKSGDYENMWRKVAMDARDFAGKYKNFAENQAAISKYMTEEGERMSKGDISKADYEANLRRIQDNYQGLRFNPETGQYENKFSANPLVKAPDMIEKINKILTNTHPTVRGYDFKGMSADNMFEYSNGSETKKLSWDEVEKYVKSGLSIDPEVQSYIAQQRELAPYMYGFSNRISEDKAKEYIINTNMGPALEYMKQGLSAKESLFRGLQDQRLSQLNAGIYGLARKGVVDERKDHSGRTLSGYGSSKLGKEDDAKNNAFAASLASPGGGATISGVGDFENKESTAVADYNKAMADYASFVKDKTLHPSDGRITVVENGVTKDVTAEANEFRKRIKDAEQEKKNYEAIKVAAMRESGYDPNNIPAALKKEAQQAYDKAYSMLHTRVTTSPTSGASTGGDPLSESQRKENAQLAYQNVIQNKVKNPLYAKYEEALVKRMNNEAESDAVVLIGNKAAKDLWSDNLTGLISGLGKDTPLTLNYANGMDKGIQLSADDYSNLEGKIDVIGFQKNEKGETELLLRATEDIKGKKTKGENLLVSLGRTDVDKWLAKNMPQEEYTHFQNVGGVKRTLSNPTRRGEFELTNDPKGPKAVVSKEGLRWKIEYPSKNGTIAVNYADGYDAISRQLMEAAMLYNGQ